MSNRISGDTPERIEVSQAFGRLAPVRVLLAHAMALRDLSKKAHWPLAREAPERGDDGTNYLIASGIAQTNELQSWFVSEHLSARYPGSQDRGIPTDSRGKSAELSSSPGKY